MFAVGAKTKREGWENEHSRSRIKEHDPGEMAMKWLGYGSVA